MTSVKSFPRKLLPALYETELISSKPLVSSVELPLSVFSNTRSTEFSFYELKTKRRAQGLSPARQALSPHDSAGGCQHHEKFSICVSLASFSRRGD